MDKIENLKKLLNTIRSSEGSGFLCDEGAILSKHHRKDGEKASLAIKILSVLGGILASATFIVVMFVLEVFDSEWVAMIIGISLIAMAVGINKKFDLLIIDTFSVSIYVLGFILLFIGMAMHDMDEAHITLIIILIALGSLFFTQNYILSFISYLPLARPYCFLLPYQKASPMPYTVM